MYKINLKGDFIMAVLSREEFFTKLMERMGSDASDEAIKFVEDVTDTYNSITANANGGENWPQKYADLDAAWRKRYMSRFFSGPTDIPESEEVKEEEKKVTEETIKPEDLFEEVEDEE